LFRDRRPAVAASQRTCSLNTYDVFWLLCSFQGVLTQHVPLIAAVVALSVLSDI
jgi:hypothetical protein